MTNMEKSKTFRNKNLERVTGNGNSGRIRGVNRGAINSTSSSRRRKQNRKDSTQITAIYSYKLPGTSRTTKTASTYTGTSGAAQCSVRR